MDLALVNNLFNKVPFYLSLGVILFFLWQVMLERKLNRHTLLAGIGIMASWSFFQLVLNRSMFRMIVVLGFAGIAVWSMIRFTLDYIDYNTRGSRSFKVGNEELFSYLASVEDRYSDIYVTDSYGEPYIFYLFFSRFQPLRQLDASVVDRTVKIDSLVGTWTKVTRIGKYHFYDVFTSDRPKLGELWVLEPGHNPGVEEQYVVRDLRGDPVFLVIDGQRLSEHYRENLKNEKQ